MKMERLIGILSILLQREKVTAPALAEQFEVFRRAIQRDIEFLCRACIPIATAQGAGGGAYKQALELLYAVAYTIKMSKLGKHKLEGYFDYVVPPLEGLWWQEGVHGVDYSRKADFRWVSLIRLPEFVTKEAFRWAVREATEKKQRDFSVVEFFSWEEGLCVQCMHIGPYDNEPVTVADMEEYATEQGYALDFRQGRFHHEIYLSDVRRCKPEKLKTVIRQPVRRMP